MSTSTFHLFIYFSHCPQHSHTPTTSPLPFVFVVLRDVTGAHAKCPHHAKHVLISCQLRGDCITCTIENTAMCTVIIQWCLLNGWTWQCAREGSRTSGKKEARLAVTLRTCLQRGARCSSFQIQSCTRSRQEIQARKAFF